MGAAPEPCRAGFSGGRCPGPVKARALSIPALALNAISRNPIARTILALILFAGSLGGLAAVSYADQYINGGVAWGTALPRIDNTVDNPRGVNLFLEKEVDAAKVEKTAQMTRDAGIKWVRQVFAWNDIEI